jgi:hypothetical protein
VTASKRRVLALVYLLAENPEVCLAGSNKAMVTFGQPDRALRRYRHALAPEIFDALIEACRGAGFSPHVFQASAARDNLIAVARRVAARLPRASPPRRQPRATGFRANARAPRFGTDRGTPVDSAAAYARPGSMPLPDQVIAYRLVGWQVERPVMPTGPRDLSRAGC